jgi:hypothetical protein
MGGRRNYSIKKVIGDIDHRQLTLSVKHGEPRDIAISSAKLVAKSNLSIKNLVASTKMLGFISKKIREKKFLNYENRIRASSEEWNKIKEHKKIETPIEIDRILISASAKAIRRRPERNG